MHKWQYIMVFVCVCVPLCVSWFLNEVFLPFFDDASMERGEEMLAVKDYFTCKRLMPSHVVAIRKHGMYHFNKQLVFHLISPLLPSSSISLLRCLLCLSNSSTGNRLSIVRFLFIRLPLCEQMMILCNNLIIC